MVKIQAEVDDYRGWEGEGIQRSVVRVQTVFQTGVCFCYKCSRLVSDSALDSILALFLAFQVRLVCLGFTVEY